MEKWKEIDGYPNYRVSNLGRVYSIRSDKLLKFENNKGYHRVTLCFNGETKRFQVHRLVGMAFIDNTENKPCINHINGIKDDNRVENLEWCTYKENNDHARETGLNKILYGEEVKHNKLTRKEVLEIRDLYKSGRYYQREIADIYNVSRRNIGRIINRERWKHI